MIIRKPLLGLVVGPKIRQVGGRIDRFITEHLSKLAKYEILCTQGTYDDLLAKHDQLTLRRLKAGPEGGFVDLANHIIEKDCDTVLLFGDPPTHHDDAPEIKALFRNSVQANADLMLTLSGATIWAVGDKADINGLPPSKQTVAFFAHEPHKDAMVDFTGQYSEELSTFSRIGGGSITRRIIERSPALGSKVDKQLVLTGPGGGDIKIANQVIAGQCQNVVFFVDPTTSHPHQADIEALLRAGRIEGINVNYILTMRSAKRWIETIRKGLG